MLKFANDRLRLASRFSRIIFWTATVSAVISISAVVSWTQSPALSSQAPSQKNAAPTAGSQSSSDPMPPVQIDGTAALHHLSQVISWYRHTTEVPSVGLAGDAIYQQNAQSFGAQAVKLAFQSAKAEAALAKLHGNGGSAASANPSSGNQTATSQTADNQTSQEQPSGATEQQRLIALETQTSAQINQLQSQIAALEPKIAKAPARQQGNLISQRDALQGELELQKALLDAIQRMAAFVETNGEIAGGLEGGINQLARSIPEVLGTNVPSKKAASGDATANSAPAPAPAPSPTAAAKPVLSNSGGLISQAMTLYDYMSAERRINQVIAETDATHALADQVRQPLRDLLRATIKQSRTLANQSASQSSANQSVANQSSGNRSASPAATSDPQQLQAERKAFDELTARFKQLSAAMLPLSEEIVVLDDSKANFNEWSNAIARESKKVLRTILLRVVAIAIALALIFVLSEVWRRITFRYITDLRRRRQFLIMRRVVTGFLVAIVLTLGFVSEFSSLATFAGFITAGIAVGLQTVLLSVAAYFFIIGRWGIRVGDRISVAGITGDVVDIGLVRLYLMELAGSGLDFYPTGRIVVFSNSVLFQAGTPLFKQIPGTEYAWHEVAVAIAPEGNHKEAQDKLVAVVTQVYAQSKDELERQHRSILRHVEINVEVPRPEARLQFADAGLELLVRYPVEIRKAPSVDDEMTRKVLELIETDASMKAAVLGTPKIRTVVKG